MSRQLARYLSRRVLDLRFRITAMFCSVHRDIVFRLTALGSLTASRRWFLRLRRVGSTPYSRTRGGIWMEARRRHRPSVFVFNASQEASQKVQGEHFALQEFPFRHAAKTRDEIRSPSSRTAVRPLWLWLWRWLRL